MVRPKNLIGHHRSSNQLSLHRDNPRPLSIRADLPENDAVVWPLLLFRKADMVRWLELLLQIFQQPRRNLFCLTALVTVYSSVEEDDSHLILCAFAQVCNCAKLFQLGCHNDKAFAVQILNFFEKLGRTGNLRCKGRLLRSREGDHLCLVGSQPPSFFGSLLQLRCPKNNYEIFHHAQHLDKDASQLAVSSRHLLEHHFLLLIARHAGRCSGLVLHSELV
mmetsp:Transcript_39133/g.91743  ORF Transcript_39133/g.91743 Transcript_39133/m.91743 type:complete len:220 (-) Transcript_39133:345-1004(-)